jgi:FKBP-type peptidyl-prolyl cis-trans isomerase FkpA
MTTKFVKKREMLKIFLGLMLIAIAGVSCLKSKDNAGCPYNITTINAPLSEQDSIKAYLDSLQIDAIQDNSGFFYKITNPGTGTDTVTLCSQILINYRGQLKNGTVFDQQNNVIFVLGSLIEGWKKGIPKVKKGGQIRLFIPPTLGYGNVDVKNNNGDVVIPAKSMLIFDVTLLDYSLAN